MAVEIVIGKKYTAEIIKKILSRWVEVFPRDAFLFFQAVSEERKMLLDSKGLSSSGHSMMRGRIPMRVYREVEKFMPGFWEKDERRQLFFQIFKKASVTGA